MRPCATVKPTTANGLSAGPTTSPARAVDERRAGERREARRAREDLRATAVRAGDRRPGAQAEPGVDAEDDVGIEHREQRVEVAGARGGEERVDDSR